MKRKTWIYYAVNTAILCLSVILLLYKNFELMDMEGQSIKFQLVIVAWTAIMVHIIKSFRLFFVLYGSNIEGKLFLKAYCKVTPVSIILPYKLGEGYKMYCYGNLMGDYLKGVLSVLLDRFADTSALITILAVICLVYESRMIPLGYFLILFLIITVVLYFVFPGLYVFWSNYLLRSKASESKIRGLKILHTLYTLHFEIRNVVEGRWTILYLISLLAWMAEIGSLILINKILGNIKTDQLVFTYLTSAMTGKGSQELSWFVNASAAILLIVYFCLCLMSFRGKRG